MAVLAIGVSIGAAPWSAEARVRWDTPGAYRLRMTGLQDFVLDAENTPSTHGLWGAHRLRLRPRVEVGAVTVQIELDVLRGQIWGDTSDLGARYWTRREGDPEDPYDGWSTVEPRELWVKVQTRYLTLLAGQVADHWGMGLMANDGRAHENDRPEHARIPRPGDPWLGDLVDRAALMVRPLAATPSSVDGETLLVIGVDHVYQDELARLFHDYALRIFGQLTWTGEAFMGGLYYLYRIQENREPDPAATGRYGGDYTYERSAIDAYGRWDVPLLLMGARLFVEAEVVAGIGSSDLFPGALNDGRAVELTQLGAAIRSEVEWTCSQIAVGLEVGYASGPGETDGEYGAMTFDPDYRVGLILFPDVLRMLSLRAAAQYGTRADLLPTRGGVRNAVYVVPTASVRFGRVRFVGALLAAWSAEPYVEPGAGGWSRDTNPLGRPPRSDLGFEGSLGLELSLTDDVGEGLVIGVDAGAFVPGSALDGLTNRGVIGKALGRIDLRW
jgi:hypothetical protein